MRIRILVSCLVFAGAWIGAQARDLEIYWIDTEGGAATLIVTPSGQSMLVDAGNPGPNDRDPKRVFEAAKAAGLSKIDILLTTHFHGDHVGGEPALSKMIPIGKFYDHGDSIEAGNNAQTAKLWNDYRAISEGKRVIVKPGDKIPLKGMDVTMVSANGEVISKLGISSSTRGGGPNEFCKDAQTKDTDKTENGRSAGFLLTYGKFKFLDVGDLTWDREMMLACPENKLGRVTLFQATHHGFVNGFSGAPALIWAIQPQVVVVNNGPRKGLEGNAYETIAKISFLEGIWQLHRALKNDAAHNTSDGQTVNFEETADCKGQGLKASIAKDGKFTITNSRNNFSKGYTAR